MPEGEKGDTFVPKYRRVRVFLMIVYSFVVTFSKITRPDVEESHTESWSSLDKSGQIYHWVSTTRKEPRIVRYVEP